MTAALLTAGCGIRMPSPDDNAGNGASAATGSERAKPGPGLPTAFVRIGDTAAQTGDFQTAAKFYRRAHEAAPQQPEPLVRLAAALQSMDSYGEAADAYRKALALDGANAMARDGLSRSEAMLAGRPIPAPPAMGGPGPQLPTGFTAPTRLTPAAGAPRIPAASTAAAAYEPARLIPASAAATAAEVYPYVARIGAYRSPDAAAQARTEIRRVAGATLAGMQVEIDETETTQGSVYWLKTSSFGSYDVAADFCDALARRALPCVVDGLVAPAAMSGDGQMVAVDVETVAAEAEPAARPETPTVIYVTTEPQAAETELSVAEAAVPADEAFPAVVPMPVSATTPVPAVTVDMTAPRDGAYQVQLAAYRTEEAALKASSRFVRAVPDLAGVGFDVQQVDFGAPRGLFHRLRVAASVDRADARRLCEAVVSRGYECMVVSAEPTPMPAAPPSEPAAEALAPVASGNVAVAEAPSD